VVLPRVRPHELGGDRKNADLIVADQHRLAAAQSGDGIAEVRAAVAGRSKCSGFDQLLLLAAAHHMARRLLRQQPLFDVTYATARRLT